MNKQNRKQKTIADSSPGSVANAMLYAVPSTHFGRRIKKAQLKAKIEALQNDYKRIGEQILLLKKQQDEISLEIRNSIDHAQVIADELLGDEYKALVGHGI